MSLTFRGNSYAVSTSSSFNLSAGNVTNPADMADATTEPIIIGNANLIAFSSSLLFTPALTPQPLTAFTSFSAPATLPVSS